MSHITTTHLGHGITVAVEDFPDGTVGAEIHHLGLTARIDRQSEDADDDRGIRPGAFVWIDVEDEDQVPDGEIHVRLHDQPIADGAIA